MATENVSRGNSRIGRLAKMVKYQRLAWEEYEGTHEETPDEWVARGVAAAVDAEYAPLLEAVGRMLLSAENQHLRWWDMPNHYDEVEVVYQDLMDTRKES